MKKEFLDGIYNSRSLVIANIDKLKSVKDFPADTSSKDVHTCELKALESKLQFIDNTISNYINIHK